MTCGSCGIHHPSNSNYCCMCGEMLRIPGQEPINARSKVCAHCGHAVRHTAKYCTQCGSLIDGTAPPNEGNAP